MTQPIWYDSTEAGAPTLNNVAGSLLEVLRACLINGFNAKSVTSIAVASGVATATCAAHGFLSTYGKLVQISGASEPLLNGNKQPGDVLTNSFTFPAPGVADGTYTGTISARRAALGWTEPHTGTNVAMFRRSAPEAGAQMLRVLDTGAAPALLTDARVLMVEEASDAATFVNPSPNAAQMTDGSGGYWAKGQNSAAAKPWCIVGTDRGFYLIGPTNITNLTEMERHPFFFGDGASFFAADPHFCLLAANSAGNTAVSSSKIGASSAFGSNWVLTAPVSFVAARSRDGATVSEAADTQGASAARFGASAAMPSGMPEKLYLEYPVLVCTNYATKEVRGIFPGQAAPIANLPFAGLGAYSLLGPMETDARTYLAVQCRAGGSNFANFCIDLTGPWYE